MNVEELFELAGKYLVAGDEDAVIEILELIHVIKGFQASEAVRAARIGLPVED